MRVALPVRSVSGDAGHNLRGLLSAVSKAAEQDADLVVFCEVSLTGLVNNGDPSHDLPLGVKIPGEETRHIANAAKDNGLLVALGLFEREGDYSLTLAGFGADLRNTIYRHVTFDTQQ